MLDTIENLYQNYANARISPYRNANPMYRPPFMMFDVVVMHNDLNLPSVALASIIMFMLTIVSIALSMLRGI